MTDDATPRILQAIQRDLSAVRDQQTIDGRKLGALAENVVRLGSRLDDVAKDIQGLRNDFQVVALAIDEHAAKLSAIEQRLPPPRT